MGYTNVVRTRLKDRGCTVDRWRDLSFEAKSAAALVAVVLLGVGGFFAATGFQALVEPS
jgi:hypothetical protein